MTDNFKLDMSVMLAFHDALRRDLKAVAQMDRRSAGWDLFERLLHVHHTAEDEALWPVVRDAVNGDVDDLALLDEMAAEHAAIGPLLEAIDAALERGDSAADARAGVAARLEQHLGHEEESALPLIDRTLTEEQWMSFGQASTERVGPDMPLFLPWLLDGADADFANGMLGRLPQPVQQSYKNEWQPAYAARDWWAPS
jgi:iron-sulfur cluster repair protein YtfE (RIC family)